MAIKPSEAGQMSQEDANEIDRIEKLLDEQIARNYIPGRPFNVARLGSNERQDRELKRRYEAAGWSVTYQSDQREGSWWEFKPR